MWTWPGLSIGLKNWTTGLRTQLVQALDPEFAARFFALRASVTSRLNPESKHHD